MSLWYMFVSKSIFEKDWKAEDGGCLRIFLPRNTEAGGEEEHYDVFPEMDRLLIFRSDRIDHEVSKNKKGLGYSFCVIASSFVSTVSIFVYILRLI